MAKMQGTPEYKDNMEELTREPATPEIFNQRYKILLDNDAYLKKEGEEIKKSVSDGKSAVASAITAMGQSTSTDATFQTMADNIKKISPTLSQSGQTVSATINGNNKNNLTVSGGELNTPGMSWNGATVTAKSTVKTAGYLTTSAEKTGTSTLTTKAATTITPGKTEQTAVSSGSRLYFSGDLKVATLGGDAVANNVLKGKKFSSDSAGRAITGTLMALSLTKLLGNYQYSALTGFANGRFGNYSFTSKQATGTPVYIRFYASDTKTMYETCCVVGNSVVSSGWKFDLSTTGIKVTYNGSGSDVYIQAMAYLPTYALGSSFVWYS